MWNIPNKDRLSAIPKLYATERVPPQEKLIHLHFSVAGCDWYVCEYDGADLFYCFVILNKDFDNAQWEFVPFSELKIIQFAGWIRVDCEPGWEIRPALEIEKIRRDRVTRSGAIWGFWHNAPKRCVPNITQPIADYSMLATTSG